MRRRPRLHPSPSRGAQALGGAPPRHRLDRHGPDLAPRTMQAAGRRRRLCGGCGGPRGGQVSPFPGLEGHGRAELAANPVHDSDLAVLGASNSSRVHSEATVGLVCRGRIATPRLVTTPLPSTDLAAPSTTSPATWDHGRRHPRTTGRCPASRPLSPGERGDPLLGDVHDRPGREAELVHERLQRG